MNILKLVRVFILPEKYMLVRKALEENGGGNLAISSIERACERSKSPFYHCNHIGASCSIPEIQLEMIVDHHKADLLISTIVDTCRNEHIDGHVIVMSGEEQSR